jgi:hypothetical protein
MIALICTLLMCGTSLKAEETPDYSEYNRLLKTYVVGDKVRYEAWVESDEDVAALKAFVEQLSKTDVDSLTESDQAAFYINLYNALMLRTVIDRYPINSVRTIGLLPFSIFKKNLIQLADREVSLDEIEKGILLKDYFDPRIHFAVNCASQGCPPLRAEPFIGNRLNEQLEEQARLFAESTRAAQVDEKKRNAAYSALFKWYAGDFGVDNPANYLNQYRSIPLPTNYTVDWIPYDWTLNDAKEEKVQ